MDTRIDSALERAFADLDQGPPKLAEAIRYAIFPGGARIRPRLCVAVAEAGGCDAPEVALGVAASLEMLHCASLVHDDLPCFDDANERRGKPSVHRVYGEALAVLTGDALIVRAFETLAVAGSEDPARLAALMLGLTRAAGAPHGLVGGQAWESESSIPLETYHRAKTGSLFVAATTLGALAAGRDPQPWRAMGERLGEAYQVADDLFDAHGEQGGKPTQRDATLMRPSAVSQHGTAGAVEKLRALVADAARSVPECRGAPMLRELVVKMAERLVPASLRQSAA